MEHGAIWDLPTRLFHWLLVAVGIGAAVTGKIGGNLIEWHGRFGLLILGLIVFRVVWGFVGSDTARFARFVRGPRAVAAYLRGEWQGVGHNPLGALAVLALLALIAAQAASGLFANDDIAFQGPLADLVGKEASDRARAWHSLVFDGLIALAVLHVGAIVFYLRVKGRNLIRPMIDGGEARATGAAPRPHHARSIAAFLIAALVASGAVYAAAGGLLPADAPPAQCAPAAW